MNKGITVEEYLTYFAPNHDLILNVTEGELPDYLAPHKIKTVSPTEIPNVLDQLSPDENYVLVASSDVQGQTLANYLKNVGLNITYLIGGLPSLSNHLEFV